MGAPMGNKNAAGPRRGYSAAREKRAKIAHMKRVGTYRSAREKANIAKIGAYQRSLYNKSRRIR